MTMKKIMFNDKHQLTKAVLDGRKTMTRRIAPKIRDYGVFVEPYENAPYNTGEIVAIAQSYSQTEDYICHKYGYSEVMALKQLGGWNNKMFVKAELMPHHIRITNIKVERLQDISYEDCLKEGIEVTDVYDVYGIPESYVFDNHPQSYYTPRDAFAALIDKTSGKGTYESNPWVYAYTFELID